MRELLKPYLNKKIKIKAQYIKDMITDKDEHVILFSNLYKNKNKLTDHAWVFKNDITDCFNFKKCQFYILIVEVYEYFKHQSNDEIKELDYGIKIVGIKYHGNLLIKKKSIKILTTIEVSNKFLYGVSK